MALDYRSDGCGRPAFGRIWPTSVRPELRQPSASTSDRARRGDACHRIPCLHGNCGAIDSLLLPNREASIMGRGILLWLLGVPIPIIILLALIWR
jgi:hypothetical protein